jgi:hypothetical protein
MTAPTNPAPLPVVACWVTTAGAPDVTTREVERITDGPSHGALAVPLALFEDAGFMAAVERREWDARPKGIVRHRGLSSWLAAIAAELRERAGVPETNFGNVGGGA